MLLFFSLITLKKIKFYDIDLTTFSDYIFLISVRKFGFWLGYVYYINNLALAEIMLIVCLYRSSHRRCSMKIGVLKNFAKFTRIPELENQVTDYVVI